MKKMVSPIYFLFLIPAFMIFVFIRDKIIQYRRRKAMWCKCGDYKDIIEKECINCRTIKEVTDSEETFKEFVS